MTETPVRRLAPGPSIWTGAWLCLLALLLGLTAWLVAGAIVSFVDSAGSIDDLLVARTFAELALWSVGAVGLLYLWQAVCAPRLFALPRWQDAYAWPAVAPLAPLLLLALPAVALALLASPFATAAPPWIYFFIDMRWWLLAGILVLVAIATFDRGRTVSASPSRSLECSSGSSRSLRRCSVGRSRFLRAIVSTPPSSATNRSMCGISKTGTAAGASISGTWHPSSSFPSTLRYLSARPGEREHGNRSPPAAVRGHSRWDSIGLRVRTAGAVSSRGHSTEPAYNPSEPVPNPGEAAPQMAGLRAARCSPLHEEGWMKRRGLATQIAIGLAIVGTVAAADQEKPKVAIPQPGVPEVMTIEGEYVRVAYNNEGYISLGYQIANESVGEEWILLEIGATVRQGKANYVLKREALSVETPDGKTLPLPSNSDYLKVNLRAMQNRANVMRDSINYFPPGATQACRIGFFADLDSRAMAYDQVELSWQRACLGRLYFHVPGGIKYGQHWLNVQFKDSLVRVPFRILTDEEKKTLRKNFGDIRKQVQEAFKPKK